MISAATAATAVVMTTLVRDHGVQYLFAATILMGLIQIVAGFLKLGRLMRFVSQSVMTGFINALAILIFMAQLPELTGVSPATYGSSPSASRSSTASLPHPRRTLAAGGDRRAHRPDGVVAARRAHRRASRRPALRPAELHAAGGGRFTLETLRILLALRRDARRRRPAREPADRADRGRHDRYGSSKNRECYGQGLANIASACSAAWVAAR